MMMERSVLLLLFYLAGLKNGEVLAMSKSDAENNLANSLLDPNIYNAAIRPVENYTDTLVIEHGLAIAQLIKLDEKSQIITTSVLIHMKWHDNFLKWDPASYGGITEFNIDIKLIWFPLIQLFNNADDSLDSVAIPKATVRYDGSIFAVMPRILKSTCKIRVKDFPFDRQICELRFGSFQFDSKKMDMKPLHSWIDMENFQSNGEWKVTKNKIETGLVYHAFSESLTFSQMSYKLQLDRKPLYYTANFLIPCILIALITILLFLIPSDTGEQMAVGVTILLSLAVFFLLLEDKVPETSDNVPLIGKYFACTIVEASLAVAAVCMVLCFHHHDPTEVPPWVKKYILGYLAIVLRLKTKETSKKTIKFENGSFKMTSMKKTDDEETRRIAKKRLLIWQASILLSPYLKGIRLEARAKCLRREKREREHLQQEKTNLVDISQEDLQNGANNQRQHEQQRKSDVNNRAGAGNDNKSSRVGTREGNQNGGGDEAEEHIRSGDRKDSQSSLCTDETRVLIKGSNENSNGMNHLGLINRVMKMSENVRERFKTKKNKDKEVTANKDEALKNALFKIEPASDWQEADHKSVKLMADTIQEGDVDDALRCEWKEVGKVINYFMMWLYIGSMILTLIVLFGPILTGKIPDNAL
eukprot:gene18037-19844_t